jgi:riboflavin synthase
MFTGIIEEVGTVSRMVGKGQDALLEINTSLSLDDVKKGDSIAVSGACLTVVEIMKSKLLFDVSEETLKRTNLKSLKPGNRVNLEKALKLNSFLGGHLVLGHIDCVGRIRERIIRSGSVIFGVEIEKEFARYLVKKGSIAVDGISLTVNTFDKNVFYVNIIPHTAEMTTLTARNVNDTVNVETDVLGKYIDRLIHPEREIDTGLLSEYGFL